MRILVLGHSGMLGNAVAKYITESTQHELVTASVRFPGAESEAAVSDALPDAIVNCIGAIPQRKPTDAEYRSLNVELPKFLDTLGVPVVYPTTDCEFAGDIPVGTEYEKMHVRDATDAYGRSKAETSAWIENGAKNTKALRTSIIGHELNSASSLLDWFLSQKGTARGYTDHYWNGNTTLEWAKQCILLLENWAAAPAITQLAAEPCASKYELLQTIKEVYGVQTEITPHATGPSMNRCLMSDRPVPPIKEQLIELRAFYRK